MLPLLPQGAHPHQTSQRDKHHTHPLNAPTTPPRTPYACARVQPSQTRRKPQHDHDTHATTRPVPLSAPSRFLSVFRLNPANFAYQTPPRSPRRGETWPIRQFPPPQTVQVEAENARFVSICTHFPGVYTKFVSISPFLHPPHAPPSRRYLWSRGHTAIPSTPTAQDHHR